MSTIKSFRGKLADAAQDTIILHTNNGSTGYRIKKFQILPVDANTPHEGTVQIFKVKQTAIPGEIDMQNNTLLAAATIQQSISTQGGFIDTVIFDNEVFNQDIYIVHDEKSAGAGSAINYYFELEQISLALDENTVATLKDIRNIAGRNDSA
tara:strand:- start:27 stop:482 length:456 start_codon:yes stop_codon:yes gene_type:complete